MVVHPTMVGDEGKKGASTKADSLQIVAYKAINTRSWWLLTPYCYIMVVTNPLLLHKISGLFHDRIHQR